MNKEILNSICVLYVEDEIDVRDFTSKLLKSIVKNIYVAGDGEEGLEIYKANKDNINLIVSDINMPKMDGLEMCSRIKEINEEIPIVITSAHNDPNFLKKAIEVGVSSYAMKPIDLYQLVESMIKAIEPIILKQKLEELNISLESRVDNEIQKIKAILDAQDNIIFVCDKTNIVNVNKKFNDFFNINTNEELKLSIDDIFNYFQTEFNFISKDTLLSKDSWAEYIRSLNEVDRVVKMKMAEDDFRVFVINIDDYEGNENYYVVSLTDITEIKEKSNLLEYKASHDPLTGLFNRNKFDDIFGKEMRRGSRYSNNLSIVLFDIDHFKNVNDTYGHQVGDQILKIISEIALESVREHDCLVRWGGEEFLILLPETDAQGAKIVADKIKDRISAEALSSSSIDITASFGVSMMKEDDNTNTFLCRVDDALYEAKNTGRNKTIVF